MIESDPEAGWGEEDSRRFLDLGRFFVPDREEQIATIAGVIPQPGDGLLVDLCCGEGLLSRALLERFSRARVLALDLSPAMLETARGTCAEFADRFETRPFDLADLSWRAFSEPVRAFVSSLAVHHLDGEGKRRLYRDLAAALAPGGAVVIADLVQPASSSAQAEAARAWDEAVRRRALELAGRLEPYEKFRELRWNLWAETEPDPIDHPSPLFDQLRWLEEAGLRSVDVYWMKAGHAIFGGTRGEP
ncbi:MAG TPA: methyltransferase domain-containing protein [Thermoanaerobaculia bacterium]|jgi:tRNA (cmo5U34)-methyltransferase|nr:methyltransferase domain-containing protein [Thermoanaerobaculia bacterium]